MNGEVIGSLRVHANAQNITDASCRLDQHAQGNETWHKGRSDARVLLVETSELPEFERTRAFYRTNGYAEETRIREFYAAGEDKVVFWKALMPQP